MLLDESTIIVEVSAFRLEADRIRQTRRESVTFADEQASRIRLSQKHFASRESRLEKVLRHLESTIRFQDSCKTLRPETCVSK